MSDFACKECHLILDEKSCPRCPDSEISREWQGFVEILDPERSELAKEMGIRTPGRYALRVR
jgi:DNA-directed RNA polymerase subunit E"|tara:strand:- start:2597 stop:2782 length:186 start_codon:yes stop_codon:yes gene_type:complete